jgi:superkiller protein 3
MSQPSDSPRLPETPGSLQAELEQLRARIRKEQSRRRRLGLALAFSMLCLVAVTLVVGVFYQVARAEQQAAEDALAAAQARQAEEKAARRQRIEQEVKKALEEAEQVRKRLHRGVAQLLLTPSKGGEMLQTARSAWKRAAILANTYPEFVGDSSLQQMRQLDKQLQSDEADWRLAKQLDEIRLGAHQPIARELNLAFAHYLSEDEPKDIVRKNVVAQPKVVVTQESPPDADAKVNPQPDADQKLAARLEQIRLAKGNLVEGKLNFSGATKAYALAFQEAGIDITKEAAEAAAQIRKSPVKDKLVAALDDWAWCAWSTGEKELAGRLLALARQTDPDAWRDQVRNPATWTDQAKLTELAKAGPVADLSPQMLELVGALLRRNGSAAEAWLRAAQQKHPADFWLNFSLGNVLVRTNPEEAIGYYRAALALRPQAVIVHNNLGMAQMARKELLGAIRAFRRTIELDPTFAGAYVNLGTALRQQKDLPAARAAYQKALALDPKLASAHVNLGMVLEQQNDFDGAMVLYRRALELDPRLAVAQLSLGRVLRQKGDVAGAIALYHKALELQPDNAAAHLQLGDALQAMGRLQEAIAHYRKALELDPKSVQAHNALGTTLFRTGRTDEAVACFQRALQLDPRSVPAYLNLGSALQAKGKLDEALALYRKALALDPRRDSAYLLLGGVLEQKKELDSALAAYRKVLELNPMNARAHYQIGRVLKSKGMVKEAAEHYRKSIQIDPKFAPARKALEALQDKGGAAAPPANVPENNQANGKEKTSKIDKGIREALDEGHSQRKELQALLARPGGVHQLLASPETWKSLLARRGQLLKMARFLEDLVDGKIDPKLAADIKDLERKLHEDEADYRLALLFEQVRLNRSVVAEGKLNDALASREYPKAFAEAGVDVVKGDAAKVADGIRRSAVKEQMIAALDDWALSAWLLGKKDLQQRLLSLARTVDPDPWRDQLRDPATWQDPQKLKALTGKLLADKKALAGLSPQMLDLVGMLLGASKADAIDWLRQAHALYPNDFWLSFNLANMLTRARPEEAARFYRAALAIRPASPVVWNNLGMVLENQKDFHGARATYQKALKIDPQFALAWVNLGNLHLAIEDLDASIACFHKALRLDPRMQRAYLSLGKALYKKRDLPGAITSYQKALELDPADARTHFYLGDALKSQGDLPGATLHYRKALRLDPKFEPARKALDALQGQEGAEARRPGQGSAACGAVATMFSRGWQVCEKRQQTFVECA